MYPFLLKRSTRAFGFDLAMNLCAQQALGRSPVYGSRSVSRPANGQVPATTTLLHAT